MKRYVRVAVPLLLAGYAAACGARVHPTPNPCICEPNTTSTVPIIFMPVPSQASVSATANGPLDCNTQLACDSLSLVVSAGKYDIQVTAPGYQNIEQAITFTGAQGACCPGLNPNVVSLQLMTD